MALLLGSNSMGCLVFGVQLVEGEVLLWSRSCGEFLKLKVGERSHVSHILHSRNPPIKSLPAEVMLRLRMAP